MKKFKAMLLAGVAALSVGALVACSGDSVKEDYLDKTLMEGTFDAFGGGKIELSLKAGGNAFFDVTCNQVIPGMTQEQVDKMFDKEATYTVKDGVFTFIVPVTDMGGNFVRNAEFKSEATDEGHKIEYVLFGQKDIPSTLTGKLPAAVTSSTDKLGEVSMNGTFDAFGGGKIELTLNAGYTATFDVTCNQVIPGMTQEQVDKMFDKEATYSVKDGVYTFVVAVTDMAGNVVRNAEFKSEATDEGHKIEYVLFGQKDIPSTLTGKLTK